MLVKKIRKGKKTQARYESSDESSDEEEETRVKRRQKKRLDRYDLATNFIPMGVRAQPQMFGGVMMAAAQPTAVMAPGAPMMASSMMSTPFVAQPMMTAAQPTMMPFFTAPR